MSIVGRDQTTVNEEDRLTRLARLCTLDEPTRRSVYQAVRRAPPASRAQVADVVGISVSLAAFHLDTLVDAGLLEAFYARPPGRGGPGAGRPAKWYQPSDVAIEVSVPPRRYELLAAILADALHTAASSGEVDTAVTAAARGIGQRLAADTPRRPRGRRAWSQALEPLGYEPREAEEGLVFGNCPFAALAQTLPATVCAANVALVTGLLEGAGVSGLSVRLQPGAGGCCVLLQEPAQ